MKNINNEQVKKLQFRRYYWSPELHQTPKNPLVALWKLQEFLYINPALRKH